MRVEGLDIALRRRASWEAVDLGVALVRRHARTIFTSWVLVTGAAFVLLNALLLPLELGWLAALLLWWMKPVFDRIPLHVLSRAILGQAPTVRQTVRAQLGFEWRRMLPWLLWRRLHPARSMLLPVDMLEGLDGSERGARARVLVRGEGSTPLLLWVIGAHLELMLWASMIVFALMLVPTSFLSEAARGLFDTWLEQPPWWMDLVENLLYWVAVSVIEPIYVGAGFALYLNRRTQLEAWDIELAFRRMAARLAPAVVLLALLLGALHAPAAHATTPGAQQGAFAMLPRDAPALDVALSPVAGDHPDVSAQPPRDIDDANANANANAVQGAASDEDERHGGRGEQDAVADADHANAALPLSQLLPGADDQIDPAFAQALARILEDPELYPREQQGEWKLRSRDADTSGENSMPGWMQAIGGFVALVIENLLWILLALAVLLLLLNMRRWLPWFRGKRRVAATAPNDVIQSTELPPELPRDPAAAVLALWHAGETRAALSLLYRAALARLVERVGRPLPPGATEAEALRLAARLGQDPFRPVFTHTVRCWQVAAYADQLPNETELTQLLSEWRGTERSA